MNKSFGLILFLTISDFFSGNFLLFGIRNSFELTLHCSISDKKVGKFCSKSKYLMLGNFCRTFLTSSFRRVVFVPREGVARVDPVPIFATNLLRDSVLCCSASPAAYSRQMSFLILCSLDPSQDSRLSPTKHILCWSKQINLNLGRKFWDFKWM